MEEVHKKTLNCIAGQTVKKIITQFNQLEVPKEDVVSMFSFGGQIYLTFYN